MPTRVHRLSKSRFIAGLQCERRLWVLVNRPEDKREPSFADQRRMEFGTEFGREVVRLLPRSVPITGIVHLIQRNRGAADARRRCTCSAQRSRAIERYATRHS